MFEFLKEISLFCSLLLSDSEGFSKTTTSPKTINTTKTKSPPPIIIFFHETSRAGDLSPRQACSVESAARAHPEWRINVLFSDVSKEGLDQYRRSKTVPVLRKFSNVIMARINVLDYSKNTPLETLVTSGALNRSWWPPIHTSDVLRYLTLYRFGGVYLDLDVVVVKPLTSLGKNWAAKENDYYINNACLAFSRNGIGRLVAKEALSDLQKNFLADSWSYNGPGVITRALEKICSTTHIAEMSSDTCRGFSVYGPQLFYPLSSSEAWDYFEAGKNLVNTDNAHVHHLWNNLTRTSNVPQNSPYAKLARTYCPSIYNSSFTHF